MNPVESSGRVEPTGSRNPQRTDGPRPTAVVGIGASAGGLEALEAFFDHVPRDSGLAYVVVQHLSPNFKSLMDELFSRHTQVPIRRVTDGMLVEPDAIYLLPPKKEMIVAGGRLLLTDKDPSQSLALPIDVFFRSLAQDMGQRAVAVVLSGSGSDGSRGVRAVHEAGGLVIVQDPLSAKFDGMPKSALDTGITDLILIPQAMPDEILAILGLPEDRRREAHAAPIVSIEELRNTNEELHSVNEELNTVNAEHQRKISQLTQLTHDMDNLLQSIDVGTIFLDRDLCIRKFTPRITDVFHILPQDIGRRLDSFATNIEYDGLVQDVARVFETEVALEREVRDRRGHWHLLRLLPYRLNSSTAGVVLTLVDVDSLKKTERERNLMSKVFMDATDPIIIEDFSGRIVHVNDEAVQVYGWSREELIGNSVELLVPEMEHHRASELRKRCRNEASVRNVETVRRLKSGVHQPVLLTLSLLRDEADQPIAIASIAKDITDRKHAELQCREAIERRDQFLAMLSHELRNPLGAVLNASYVLNRNCTTKHSCKSPCKVIERQTHLMARLLDDLLDVSRVMQGKIDIRMEPCDLRKAVDSALEVVRPQIDGRDQQLSVDIESTPLVVMGDLMRLQQIHVNLLTNSMKYTPAGGRIWLTVRQEDQQAVIRVRDSGEGIPTEMLQSIFDLFVQAGGTLDRSDGGMGVGLTLVQKLVELHGGTVAAYSEGPGQGSEFVVQLPLGNPADVVANPIEVEPEVTFIGRILVVEDNADSREMLKALLELHGYQVEAAEDGRKGLEILQKDNFDIALVDIGLPGIDGYEVAQRIRKDPRHSGIRLVALTGYGRTADREAVQAAGFDEHLVKPLDQRQLTSVLTKYRTP